MTTISPSRSEGRHGSRFRHVLAAAVILPGIVLGAFAVAGCEQQYQPDLFSLTCSHTGSGWIVFYSADHTANLVKVGGAYETHIHSLEDCEYSATSAEINGVITTVTDPPLRFVEWDGTEIVMPRFEFSDYVMFPTKPTQLPDGSWSLGT